MAIYYMGDEKLHYGLLDIEMTCDGKQENGKFIDDGRMKRSQREIISVGFVVCDDKYNIKNRYYSFVKILQLQLIVRNLLESHKLMLTVERSAIMLFAILMKCASDIP